MAIGLSFGIAALTTVLHTGAAVLWFLGVMPNSVYTLPPVATMSIVIVAAAIYTILGVLFLFMGPIDNKLWPLLEKASGHGHTHDRTEPTIVKNLKQEWRSVLVVHISKTVIALYIGLVYAIYYYAEYKGRGTPTYTEDGEVWWFYKIILFYLLVVYVLEVRSLLGLYTEFATKSHIINIMMNASTNSRARSAGDINSRKRTQ
jgi:hypothetical protein